MKNIFKIICVSLVFFSVKTNAQTLTALQMQNARATGYAIVAARNPGKSFSVYLVKWDGVHDLEYNANNQINSGWHPQAVIKGNYFSQPFDGTDFTTYSSVVVSQSEFDTYKATGSDWWIVCSTLPAFSNSGLLILENGKVGIGTTSPSSKLDVYSDTDLGVRFSGIRTHRPGVFGQFAFMDYNVNGDVSFFGSSYTGSAGQYGKISFRQYTQGDVYRDAMYIDNLGNIGIGTTNPVAKLDVIGEGHFKVPDDRSGIGGLTIETNNGTYLKIGGNSAYSWIQSHNSKPLYINELGNNTILNLAGSNVGIGTTAPDEKLTVKGKIHTQEVRVDMLGPLVPDYVFASDYKLKSLEEVEEYINKKGHLPEIPSAKEIEKNGLMLAEMNMSLLKKMEEMTLYMIEQDKKLKAQSEEIATFKNVMERLSKIEEKLETKQ
jgi:hypothetical protein